MHAVVTWTCLPLEAHRSPRHSPARRTTCIISFYIMAGHFRSDSTATFDTLLDTVLRGAPPPGYTARWPQVRPPALALALPFARPYTSLAACGAHVAQYARPPMPKTPQYLPALPVCACPRRRSAHRRSWWRGKCAGPLRLPVPPLRPGARPANRGSASVPRQGASQSALGNHPLNHIQEALLRLFAGLLDLLEPEFASSRGARRMPRAQRLRAPEG